MDSVENNIGKNLVTLGPIIHNKIVVDSLSERGVRCAAGIEDIKPGYTVVIRSHGVPESIYKKLEENGNEYIDAT